MLRLPVCSSKEYLYREEFESYVKEGVLSMHTAFSREQAGDTSPTILSPFRDASCLVSFASNMRMRLARSMFSTGSLRQGRGRAFARACNLFPPV